MDNCLILFVGTPKDSWEKLSDKGLKFWRVGLGRKIRGEGYDFQEIHSSLSKRILAIAILILLAPVTIPLLGFGLLTARISKSYSQSHQAWRQSFFPSMEGAFANIAEELPIIIAKKLDICDLLTLGKTSRRMRNLCDDNTIWRRVAEQLGFNDIVSGSYEHGEIKAEIKRRYLLLVSEVRTLPVRPLDIEEALLARPTCTSYQFLRHWQKARDILLVWEKMATAIGQTVTHPWDDGHHMIEQATGFQDWVTANRASLAAIRSFDLRDLALNSLPPEIGELTGLRYLGLYGNNLTSLPPEIGRLTGLQIFTPLDNQLTSLPPEIGNLTSLTHFWLDENPLTSLPSVIGNLTNLESLRLSGGRLTSLPPEIGKLTALGSLVIGHNQLTSLPPEIRNLTALYTLTVVHNQLTSLPPEIGNLTNLQSLRLSGNRLTTLPAELGALNILTNLTLLDNPLISFPPEVEHLRSVMVLGRLQRISLSVRRAFPYLFAIGFPEEREGSIIGVV